ncbi:MAG TPA: hypothetical protein VF573_17380 [Paraburkholderia sp.]
MNITQILEKALAEGPTFVIALVALLVVYKALTVLSKDKDS